ncbi:MULTISPECIES: sugar phosphate isomerase/epimerase family protein [Aliiglaciecola]|uniref:sugar phosphate isomerase/epimerase family protein n=1 Tax=Aliiglaciecola TaxID=1406885 RepID=UPI001C096B6C|nr:MULTISPECIES: sugar phosphate isomerase/epimerase [Aliiglaciecola]MBU2876428.1 sugar phosphate isomerase/epimerase [Aliiglaciecola lipolytica]MDO6712745.1 sugar phosphate isomerase/epimerase [Aliiglaciecola sp. 2_MG-2023]MDO6753856.1 sugar phosphate isomerase/epimerase [Aliiglaciecola sp. 1_MG-2023]
MRILTALTLIFVFTQNSLAQNSIDSQVDRLHQYVGHWVSSEHAGTESIATFPAIRMHNTSTMNKLSMQVEVLQYQDGKYLPILTELIGYDAKSKKIIALGQNQHGAIFKGMGRFTSETKWEMQDLDMLGNFYLRVEFDFQSPTNVLLEGYDESGKSLWKTRYIKSNPKDKNIGIQLVSVHQQMLKDPEKTLRELARMGYSYVETFVYENGTFYGMPATEFRDLVEGNGMLFWGSMTFHDLPAADDWEDALEWWSKTIDDHVAAGVKYLTTSNNQLSSIKNKGELKRYSDYYNAIGKLCREKGITFAFHNHADEFKTVEGTRIYDYFLEHTDPEYVYFQADIYWMQVAGVEPIDYFKKYSDRFLSWHIKDYKELGASGEIDWMALFHHADFNPPKYMVAEVEDYSYPPMHSVQLAWEYLYHSVLK